MSTRTRYAIIFNPTAGKGRAAGFLPSIKARLDAAGVEYGIMSTERVGHAVELAAQAVDGSWDLVCAAGGDGTCNEVINGLMSRTPARGEPRPILAVLPLGRGNDFSYGAGVPGDLDAALTVLLEAAESALDLGFIRGGFFPEGRYFGNGIGIGFDTMVGLAAARKKNVHSALGYLAGAFEVLLRYPAAPAVEVRYKDRLVRARSHQISILNGRRMGGMFYMAPFAERSDGQLDLCMADRPLTRRDMLVLIMSYLKGTQHRSKMIITDRAGTFTITAPAGGLVCHADGETVCTDGTALEVSCLPAALRLRCDPALPAYILDPPAHDELGSAAGGEPGAGRGRTADIEGIGGDE